MTIKDISRFLSAGLCLAVFLASGLMGMAAAEQSYYGSYPYHIPQNAQEREDLFKVLHNLDDKSVPQAALYAVDPYRALQNPYAIKDPQSALERANTLKAFQKLTGAYYNPLSEDNWNYWAYMWLNGPQTSGPGGALDIAGPYTALQNPYAIKDPQSALERANTLKAFQKLTGAYYNPLSEDNWNYWAYMWLSGP